MGRTKILIGRELLEKLYLRQNLTPLAIGKLLGCSFKTVRNRLEDFGIPFKNPSLARMRYLKSDFDTDLFIRAYMVGFRIGDLNVYVRSPASETIVVRCHTTQREQVMVIQSLFKKFGQVSVSPREGHFTVNCFLNRTFMFLLSKKKATWQWIRDDDKLGPSFMAGYIDAEGNFIINQGRGRFKVDSYDYNVLKWMFLWLGKHGVNCKLRCIDRKRSWYKNMPPLKKDLWRLNVNEASSLERFVNIIRPFLRHRIRIRDAETCLRNIKTRRSNGTIM